MPEEAEAVGLRTDSRSSWPTRTHPPRAASWSASSAATARSCAAPRCRGAPDAPLLGVNLGHVGFLAEAEREDLEATVERIVTRDYTVEERMTLDVRVATSTARWWRGPGRSTRSASRRPPASGCWSWSLEIDGRPLSTFGC